MTLISSLIRERGMGLHCWGRLRQAEKVCVRCEQTVYGKDTKT